MSTYGQNKRTIGSPALAVCLASLCTFGCNGQHLSEAPGLTDHAEETAHHVLVAAGSSSPLESDDQHFDSDNVKEQFICYPGGDFLTLPVYIGGQEFAFVLDTGSEITVVDSSLQHLLLEKDSSRDLTDGSRTEKLRKYGLPADSRVGKSINLSTIPFVLSLDFAAFRDVTGVPLYGVLGSDFLRSQCVQIDFDSGRVLFLKSVGDSTVELGYETAMDTTKLPTVEVKLDEDQSIDVVIDSGAFGISTQLDQHSFASMKERGWLEGAADEQILNGIGKTTESSGAIIDMSFAGETLIRVETHTGPYNLLGLDFLSRFSITLDFVNSKAFFRPSSRLQKGGDKNLTGARLSRQNGQFVVINVDRESIAWNAGLRQGDRVISVNGCDASELRTFEMRSAMASTQGPLAMKVRRGEEVIAVSMQATQKVADANTGDNKLGSR